jgi:HAD superfamily hydrolase (TIGR01509 family)
MISGYGGLVVSILTNGTDTVTDELVAQGIRQHVDYVFNSWDIGFIKPDQRVFRYVMGELGLEGAEIFFADNSPSKLTGAIDLGFATHHFRSLQPLHEALMEAGVL